MTKKGQNPLEHLSKTELQHQGLTHSINLHGNEDRPQFRIASIKGEISEIEQSLFWMMLKTSERNFWQDLSYQRWGTVEHARAEINKGLETIRELNAKMGIIETSVEEHFCCYKILKPKIIIGLCECGDLVAIYSHIFEDNIIISTIINSLSEEYNVERTKKMTASTCPNGHYHYKLIKIITS